MPSPQLRAFATCSKYVKITLGKREIVHELLSTHWGMVFFTGGGFAARAICKAAAEHLSPVCMELGGKNPVYVTRNANLETAVLKLVDNKFQNVGQFCVSPDHVYLDSQIDVNEFTRLLKEAVQKYFGDDPQQSKNYSRVINASHHQRLVQYRSSADHGGVDLLEGMGWQTADEVGFAAIAAYFYFYFYFYCFPFLLLQAFYFYCTGVQSLPFPSYTTLFLHHA